MPKKIVFTLEYGVPPGTVVGNPMAGHGPAQPMKIGDLAAALLATGILSKSNPPAVSYGWLVNGDVPVGFITDPSGQLIGVPL